MTQEEKQYRARAREINANIYQAMKIAAKKRKIKLSAEGDIYKKVDPYFFNVFHLQFIKPEQMGESITYQFDPHVKYARFDELQHNIVHPNDPQHFTDKLRANSGMMFTRSVPRLKQLFPYDGTDEAIPQLCEDVLDFLARYYRDYLQHIAREYGDLNGYYIAEKDTDPYSAGLAYLDRGEYKEAAACFSLPQIKDRLHQIWTVPIETDEQYRRACCSGGKIFSDVDNDGIEHRTLWRPRADQFRDYAVALQNGLEWTSERAMFGLLSEELKM